MKRGWVFEVFAALEEISLCFFSGLSFSVGSDQVPEDDYHDDDYYDDAPTSFMQLSID